MALNPVAGKLISGRDLTLNIVFRKYDDGVVAECVEIPGCLSQGDTEEEAKQNIALAIEECLSVILEDAIGRQKQEMNMVGIERQEKITVRPLICEQEVFV
jgi:predicted RNase H-like HicB family nuclease